MIDVEITNPYQFSKLSGGSSTIIDVKAKDGAGNIFLLEIQIAEADFFNKRILYDTSQSYTAQLDKGVDYSKFKPSTLSAFWSLKAAVIQPASAGTR